MKKSYPIVLVALFFLFAIACSFGQFKEGIDKGAKIYTLVPDNTDLIQRMYNQIEKAEIAFMEFQKNRNAFTQGQLIEETVQLYYTSLELKKFLKEIGFVLKEE